MDKSFCLDVDVEHGARRAKVESSLSAEALRRQEFSSTALEIIYSDYSGIDRSNFRTLKY